jgi:hypothetical protein
MGLVLSFQSAAMQARLQLLCHNKHALLFAILILVVLHLAAYRSATKGSYAFVYDN